MKVTVNFNFKKFRELLYAFLKDKGLKVIIKKVLTATAIGGGIKAWIIKEIIEEFYEEIGEPIFKALIAKSGYTYYKVEGKILIKRAVEAQNENNQNDYDSAIDDIYN